MFRFFNKNNEKKEIEQLKNAVQTGFNSAKQDVHNISTWIKHLDSKNNQVKNDISGVKEEIASMKDEIENLKNIISIMSNKQSFKQTQTLFNKQTSSVDVLNSVQTSVQTEILEKLSSTERAIVFVLLNSDLKLSYEDLASMLGKNKATIRGQINAIKQKSESLILEVIGENNKKRVFIPENIKEILLKKRKVRVKSKENNADNDTFYSKSEEKEEESESR